jgi:hypothetical protein
LHHCIKLNHRGIVRLLKYLALALLVPSIALATEITSGATRGSTYPSSGGGGSTAIVSGTTTITSGADKSVCFDDGGIINCGDSTLQYTKGTGSLAATTFVGALTGNSSTATALAANPADCGAGTKAISIAANGDLTCSAVSLTADVSGILPIANGGLNLSAATDDNVPVGNGTTWQSKTLPNCTDTGGNHLNYTQSTNAFSCGTSGGGGGGISGLTTNVLPKASSSTTIADSSLSDDGATISTAEPISVVGIGNSSYFYESGIVAAAANGDISAATRWEADSTPSGNTARNLPAATGSGRRIGVIKVDPTGGDVHVLAQSGESVNGNSPPAFVNMGTQGDAIDCVDIAVGIWICFTVDN